MIGICTFAYHRLGLKTHHTPTRKYTAPMHHASSSLAVTKPKLSFTCDGRRHCSQMTSRAEAEYSILNCPNTKMDGDRDGIACENDSRF